MYPIQYLLFVIVYLLWNLELELECSTFGILGTAYVLFKMGYLVFVGIVYLVCWYAVFGVLDGVMDDVLVIAFVSRI